MIASSRKRKASLSIDTTLPSKKVALHPLSPPRTPVPVVSDAQRLGNLAAMIVHMYLGYPVAAVLKQWNNPQTRFYMFKEHCERVISRTRFSISVVVVGLKLLHRIKQALASNGSDHGIGKLDS